MQHLPSHRSKTRCITHVIRLLLQQPFLSLGALSPRTSTSTQEMALDLREALLNCSTVSNLIHHITSQQHNACSHATHLCWELGWP
jgi:hypothetical protein